MTAVCVAHPPESRDDVVRIGVAAGRASLDALAPLIDVYGDRRTVQSIDTGGIALDGARLAEIADEVDALLWVGPRRRAPRTVVQGPVLRRSDGSPVPVGWLPEVGARELRTFAIAAAQVHRRPPASGPFAVLGQWNPKYLNLADRIERLLAEGPGAPRVYRWTSDRIMREELVRGLGTGLAAAMYVGHGRPIGWVGYHGTRLHHFAPGEGEPLGVLFSLCCGTASRRRTSLSFSEGIPLAGVAAACFGAVEDTLHIDNARWALRLCIAMRNGAATLSDLVRDAAPDNDQAIHAYRILGDPLAPLSAASHAVDDADRIESCA